MNPPWWFCCGWWSPWCVLDTALHRVYPIDGDPLPRWARWICDRHDARITQEALR